ncbi:exodeoxyribonuclease VII small subunit [Gracilibacillus boraciitolerans JCM 21714]|uniref:Exodeoxyribonuclease 7 small subunit n=1 Tax=Gracilibacillus boraciitolerans JCM 21714 TaxID=1298598 RepID=W4VDJ1_9BACI|nr:exodeoxyribonuclease VII small subunit [Gracilibacillus boraciitolerans]GAE91251.1 exodeoxyribonuclease VII small subunit [Gracilibacillus boraciitolerans JCM 21714]
MNEKKNELSFEEALEQLEEIVNKMEEGEVPLEKAMEYYAKGSKLSKICHDKLAKADKQIKTILTDENKQESFEIQEDK